MTEPLLDLLRAHDLGVLATIKRDGRPQLSNVNYTIDEAARTVRVSVTDDRAKVYNVRRDPRVSLLVMARDGWTYAVAEGTAELTPVAAAPDDPVVEELIDVFRLIGGEHPDWAEYRAAMVADKRLVLRLQVDRVYGRAS